MFFFSLSVYSDGTCPENFFSHWQWMQDIKAWKTLFIYFVFYMYGKWWNYRAAPGLVQKKLFQKCWDLCFYWYLHGSFYTMYISCLKWLNFVLYSFKTLAWISGTSCRCIYSTAACFWWYTVSTIVIQLFLYVCGEKTVFSPQTYKNSCSICHWSAVMLNISTIPVFWVSLGIGWSEDACIVSVYISI